MATSWFLYDGTSGNNLQPTHYNPVSVTPSCSLGSTVCAIFAETQIIGTPPKPRPIITSTLTAEINAARNTGTPSANVKLRFP